MAVPRMLCGAAIRRHRMYERDSADCLSLNRCWSGVRREMKMADGWTFRTRVISTLSFSTPIGAQERSRYPMSILRRPEIWGSPKIDNGLVVIMHKVEAMVE